MSFESAGYQLLPVLPELVLAVGAMVLLMIGAYRGTQTTGLVTGLAVCLLVLVGALELWLPAGKLTTFGGSFIVDDFARFLKILALIGSAATLILVDGISGRSVPAHLRICDPGAALDARHDGADLGRRPDHALSRARADVARALRGRSEQSRQCEIDRSRAEVFRAGRAVVRHAAVRRLADLRLYRHRQLCRYRGSRRRPAASASCSVWCSCSPGFASRFRRCRSICGRPTCMRAHRRR